MSGPWSFIHRDEETEAVGIEAWKAAPVGRRRSAFMKARPRKEPPAAPALPAEDNDPEEDRAEVCAVRLRCG